MSGRLLKDLPSVSELVKLYQLSAKKKLGQNFLLETNLADKFVRAAGNLDNSHVIEVGAGPGTLTRAILNAGAKRVTVIEKDRRFLPCLQLLADAVGSRMKIFYGDALEIDYERIFVSQTQETSNIKIIGNLPFNVATPLFIKYLEIIANKQQDTSNIIPIELTLSFQKEVAARIVASPNTAERSRLSTLTQSFCDANISLVIPGSMFVPPPKVLIRKKKIFTKKINVYCYK